MPGSLSFFCVACYCGKTLVEERMQAFTTSGTSKQAFAKNFSAATYGFN